MNNQDDILMEMVGNKTRFIITLLLLLYLIPLIIKRDFYPIQAYRMFSELRTEEIGVLYKAFAIDENKEPIRAINFSIWPVRKGDFHNSIERWVKEGTLNKKAALMNPAMLHLLRGQYPTIKCFGIEQLTWLLSVPPSSRAENIKYTTVAKFCEDK